jgi:hypothetical protein
MKCFKTRREFETKIRRNMNSLNNRQANKVGTEKKEIDVKESDGKRKR